MLTLNIIRNYYERYFFIMNLSHLILKQSLGAGASSCAMPTTIVVNALFHHCLTTIWSSFIFKWKFSFSRDFFHAHEGSRVKFFLLSNKVTISVVGWLRTLVMCLLRSQSTYTVPRSLKASRLPQGVNQSSAWAILYYHGKNSKYYLSGIFLPGLNVPQVKYFNYDVTVLSLTDFSLTGRSLEGASCQVAWSHVNFAFD